MAELINGGLADVVEFSFANLTPDEESDAGGAVSVANVQRTLSDIRTVYARASGADVVHIHSALAPAPTLFRAGLLAGAAKARGAAVVMHAHGGRVVDFVETRGRKALSRLCLGRPVDRAIAVADSVTSALSPVIGSTMVTTIPNGVDCARFVPRDGRAMFRPEFSTLGTSRHVRASSTCSKRATCS